MVTEVHACTVLRNHLFTLFISTLAPLICRKDQCHRPPFTCLLLGATTKKQSHFKKSRKGFFPTYWLFGTLSSIGLMNYQLSLLWGLLSRKERKINKNPCSVVCVALLDQMVRIDLRQYYRNSKYVDTVYFVNFLQLL